MPRQQTVQGVFLDCHMRPPSASLSPHTRFLTVPFLRSQRFEKLTMRLKPRTEVSAHLARRPRTASFEALHPLDGRGLAHPEARRSRPPAHPSPNHRVDHPVAQVLRICTGHPRWPPPSQQVESEQCRFGNPNRFKLDTACSRTKVCGRVLCVSGYFVQPTRFFSSMVNTLPASIRTPLAMHSRP